MAHANTPGYRAVRKTCWGEKNVQYLATITRFSFMIFGISEQESTSYILNDLGKSIVRGENMAHYKRQPFNGDLMSPATINRA